MKLSIGMIVKNEEKYIRQCLEAMKPVLEQLDSELIIADTGSTDSTVDIAKEYTEQVFHFDWCNDFSAARNSTIERAKGEWLMTVDADEVFEDVSKLIDFFNSGEYKKYNSATFVQRNYSDQEHKISSDFNAPRLTKLTKETRYKREIHEVLTTYGNPIKILPVVANHYGYISQINDEFTQKKAQRNIDLLEKRLEQRPNDFLDLMYISQTYFFKDDIETAMEYCSKGLSYAIKAKNMLQYTLYSLKAGYLHKMQKYSQALDLIDEYFSARTGVIGTDLEMYFLQADSRKNLGDHAGAAASYIHYVRMYQEFKRGMHQTPDTTHHSICFTDQVSFDNAVNSYINGLLLMHDYETVVGKAAELSGMPSSLLTELHELSIGLQKMNKAKDFSALPELYERIDETNQNLLLMLLEKGLETEAYKPAIFAEFEKDEVTYSDYDRLMRLRHSFERGTLTKEDVEHFFLKVNKWKNLYADAVYIAIAMRLPASRIVKKAAELNVSDCLFLSAHLHYKDLGERIGQYSAAQEAEPEVDCPDVCVWLSEVYQWALTHYTYDNASILPLFRAFAKETFAYLHRVCKEEILSEENARYIFKPFRAGFYCYLAVCALDVKDIEKAAKSLKTALEIDPSLGKTMKIMLKELQAIAPKHEPSEFEILAKSVKEKIVFLIEKGEKGMALQVLQSYEQLCPGDTEIAGLKQRIEKIA